MQAKPGQASPRRERVREKEGKRDDGGGVEKKGEGQSCCLFFLSFFFFNLRERTCLFSFFFFPDSLSASPWDRILLLSSPLPLLFLTSSLRSILPPSAQLRLHLSPATEAPTPADPPQGSRGQRREKVRAEGTMKYGVFWRYFNEKNRPTHLFLLLFHMEKL